MSHWRGKRYPVGTKVQYRNGYIVVKTEDGMVAESRRNWEMSRGDLEPGDKVFHIDGDRTNNSVRNLAKVHFNQTKFTFLKASKVLYMPSTKASILLPTIRTLDKKTGKVLLNS